MGKKYGVGGGKAAAQMILLPQLSKSELLPLLLPLLLPTLLLLKPLLRALSTSEANSGRHWGRSSKMVVFGSFLAPNNINFEMKRPIFNQFAVIRYSKCAEFHGDSHGRLNLISFKLLKLAFFC